MEEPIAEKKVTTTCSRCRNVIDVTGLEPGDGITCPYCSHEFLITRQFGNFLLERQLGSGSMGSVYLAKDMTLNRVVAVKVLKRALVTDQKFMATFLRVAQLTASLNDPHIARVYTFGEQDGIHYLVIEYISGGSLSDKIEHQGRITELEGVEIGLIVARVLESALQRGLIHRNIKPSNILFTNNEPKVVDFGLALSFETTGLFDGGIPYYVAPEKLDHQPEDFRSDMYSLAATLFHAIAGRPPYEGKDANDVAMKHLSGKVVLLKTLAPDVSDRMSALISKAMSRYPDDRYESYAALIEHLEDVKHRLTDPNFSSQQLQHVGIAQPEGLAKRNLGLIVGLVAVAVILIGFFVWKGTSQNAPVPHLTDNTTNGGTQTPPPSNPPPAPLVNNVTPSPQETPPPTPSNVTSNTDLNFSGYSQIIAKSSGLSVVVENAAKTNGAFIIQSTGNGPNLEDQWQIIHLDDGHYKILNRNSNLALQTRGRSPDAGAKMIQYSYNKNHSQPKLFADEWTIEPTDNGYYRLINVYSGMPLEISGNSKSAGGGLDQAPWTGADNQQFKIVNVP